VNVVGYFHPTIDQTKDAFPSKPLTAIKMSEKPKQKTAIVIGTSNHPQTSIAPP
jgi:hypothetical protein